MDEALQAFIAEYGKQSYRIAVNRTAIGYHLGDLEHAEKHAAFARELLQLGYHKYEETDED